MLVEIRKKFTRYYNATTIEWIVFMAAP